MWRCVVAMKYRRVISQSKGEGNVKISNRRRMFNASSEMENVNALTIRHHTQNENGKIALFRGLCAMQRAIIYFENGEEKCVFGKKSEWKECEVVYKRGKRK